MLKFFTADKRRRLFPHECEVEYKYLYYFIMYSTALFYNDGDLRLWTVRNVRETARTFFVRETRNAHSHCVRERVRSDGGLETDSLVVITFKTDAPHRRAVKRIYTVSHRIKTTAQYVNRIQNNNLSLTVTSSQLCTVRASLFRDETVATESVYCIYM